MQKTIVALFHEKSAAEQARKDLIRTGLKNDGIQVEDSSSGDLNSRLHRLKNIGMPERHAEAYCEGLRRGGGLLIANVEDTNVAMARQILQRDGAINVDQKIREWEQSGWTGFSSKPHPMGRDANTGAGVSRRSNVSSPGSSRPTTSASEIDAMPARDVDSDQVNRDDLRQSAQTRRGSSDMARPDTSRSADLRDRDGVTIPVVEEDLNIGKREVEQGGVRINQRVTEKPVEDSINLREEHVNVERKKVDRPISNADMAHMKDETIEVTEHREEPVIHKEARVKEEIRVNRTADQHTETVRDTVRSTEVDVEKIDSDINPDRRRMKRNP